MIQATPRRSALHRRCGVGLGGGDCRRRLGRERELQAVEQESELGLGLGVAGQADLAAVGGRDVDVDHLHGGELLEGAARGEPGGEGGELAAQRDVQAIGEEGDEDVGLDAPLALMMDRADGEVALEGSERLLDIP